MTDLFYAEFCILYTGGNDDLNLIIDFTISHHIKPFLSNMNQSKIAILKLSLYEFITYICYIMLCYRINENKIINIIRM